MRALEKDPARRFQSAEEFIAALEQARRAPGRPVVLDPTPGRAVGRRGGAAAARAGGSGCWRCSRWPRSASARTCCWPATKVEVPNLVGRQADEVDRSCSGAGWRSRSSHVESDDVQRDEVISQDPGAGDGGPGGHDRERRDLGRAAARCRSRRSRASRARTPSGRSRTPASRSRSSEAYSDDVPEGDVISSSPAGGTPATKGRTVTITVSSRASGIAVPKVVGLQRDEAEAQLEAAGLRADVTEQETTQPPGTVMKQDPAVGDPRRPWRDRRAHRCQGTTRGART